MKSLLHPRPWLALILGLVLAGGTGQAQTPTPAAAPTPAPAAPAAPAVTDDAAVARPGRTNGKVAANSLMIRARPDQKFEVIGKFKMGDKVQAVAELNDWYEVVVPASVDAFVSTRFLDADGKVLADRIQVRSGPGIVYNAYSLIKRGELVKKLGEPTADGWQKIEAPAGATAWVGKKFVFLDESAGKLPQLKEEPRNLAGPEAAAAEKAAGGDQTETATAAPGQVTSTDKAAVTDTAKLAVTDTAKLAGADTGKPAEPVKPLETSTATLKTATAETATPAPDAVVMKEGVVLSLKDQASKVATHLLAVQKDRSLQPDCYLISPKIALQDWENQAVRIHGREIWYPGWKRPVLEVTGIQKLAK